MSKASSSPPSLAGQDGSEPTRADAIDITACLSIGAARHRLTDAFRRAGIDHPELDARVLLAHALELDRAALATDAGRILSPQEAAEIALLAGRRLAGEPVARIVGWKEFWSLPIRLGPATLVPRPETETVVEAALAIVDGKGLRAKSLRIADLGTGSGALLLALLRELPNAFGVGTDIAPSALAVARDNAARLGLGERAAFVACELAAALAGPFDLVVSNPPYIKTRDIAGLPDEVRDYDPKIALDGGPDGLAFYRVLATDAERLLGGDGSLVVELGAGAAEPVAALFSAAGLVTAPPRADLAGIARALAVSCAACV